MQQRGTIRLGRGGLPTGVKILLGLNIAAYLLSVAYLNWSAPGPGKGELLIHLMLIPQFVLHGEVWQLVTYMFLHDFHSPMHLLFNMFMLWMLGGIFEPMWGTRRFLFFYMACGLGAGVTSVLAHIVFPGVEFFQAPILGASGAVLGLVIAYGMTFPESHIYLFFVIPVKGKHIAIATVILDIGVNFLGMNVASQTHIGGMLTAFLMLTGFWRPSRLKKLRTDLEAKRRHAEMRKRFMDATKKGQDRFH